MRASFLLLIYTLIVILVAPVLLVCWVLGLREPLMAIGRWAMRVGRRVLGIDVEVSGLERFDHKASYVFMPNHLSFLDGPMMVMLIPQSVRVILKKNVFGIPILGWAMRYVGCVPVNRRAGGGGIKSIEKAVRSIREKGYSFLIFPEGTRSVDGKLQRFRRGGFLLAIAGGGAHRPGDHRGDVRIDAEGPVRGETGDGQRRIPSAGPRRRIFGRERGGARREGKGCREFRAMNGDDPSAAQTRFRRDGLPQCLVYFQVIYF